MNHRKFDHGLALRLHSEGWKPSEIAAALGVSDSGVRRVVVPGVREGMNLNTHRYQWKGVCPDCGHKGTLRTYQWIDSAGYRVVQPKGVSADDMRAAGHRRELRSARCEPCQDTLHAQRVFDRTVTDEFDTWRELWCNSCAQWKHEDLSPAPPAARPHRRRGIYCSTCSSRKRRSYRDRHRVPCENGCGRLVEGKGRPNWNHGRQLDPDRPYLCIHCWHVVGRPSRSLPTSDMSGNDTGAPGATHTPQPASGVTPPPDGQASEATRPVPKLRLVS